MSKINILDCTLRDGGYVNEWDFGERSIREIICKLSQSNIDIIECGFLREGDFDKNKTLFNCVEKIRDYIEPKNKNISYVAMIDQPYISIDKISECSDSIDGIRVTFHSHEVDEALSYGKKLIEKGYKVFIQPVGTTSYSDKELLQLVKKVNELNPYAFYLVDTLGIMYKNGLLRMFHLLDNNLNKSIAIGFHSHNNLQLSFSNAQELLMLHSKREIIIDSSVSGMGRGAGNLCTELITHYINENLEEKYYTVPLLEIIDEHLSKINTETKWGYSIPYYIAAINNCHPNYATYLLNKQTISVKSINAILMLLLNEKKDIYDEKYIEDLYLNHQVNVIDDNLDIEVIKGLITEKKVLIIAPGKSIESQKDKLQEFINKNNPWVFSVNFIPNYCKCDAVFVSNRKRFKYLLDVYERKIEKTILITTSNITKNKECASLIVNYSDLLVENPIISDNAGLMLINLLKRLSVRKVYLAGFDGFKINKEHNYFSTNMINNVEIEELLRKNEAISSHLDLIKQDIEVDYVTPTIYAK